MRDAGILDRFLVLLGLRQAVRVSGTSMVPTLNDEDIAIVTARFTPAIGDIVLVKHPFKQSVSVLKRVAAIVENGRVELLGDNADESTDSRTFGSVPIEYIKGKAVSRFRHQ